MINYNIKGKGGEEQDPGLLSWGRGERLGLAVEEGERLGLCSCCLSSTARSELDMQGPTPLH
jgi:hypothetical protein